jgi:malignant T-cell-amplified sequence
MLFKKFNIEEHVSSTGQIKNSVLRGIHSSIVDQFPYLEASIDNILPKKSTTVAKCQGKVQIILVDGVPMFFNERDGPYFPTLKVLHKYPSFLKRLQADKGAIPFILSGANIMTPGFTSTGGSIPIDIAIGEPVAIYAEGKEHALAVGFMKMSTDEMKSTKKGIAVENIHYLLDGLYMTKTI